MKRREQATQAKAAFPARPDPLRRMREERERKRKKRKRKRKREKRRMYWCFSVQFTSVMSDKEKKKEDAVA